MIEWARRGKGTKAYYASQFKRVFGRSLDDAWKDWTSWEHAFQQKNLDAVRSYPLTPYTDISRQGLGSVSRAYYDADKQALYAGLNYPGIVSHLGAISLEDGAVRKIVDIKGPRIYTVTSLAWDAASRTLFYTSDNNAAPGPAERLARHGPLAPAAQGRPHRRARLLGRGQGALRHPHPERPRDARAHPAALRRVAEPLHLALRRGGLRPRPVGRRRASSRSRTATRAGGSRCEW